MVSKIFVNLPVKDLDTSITFFEAVGFSFNPQFTDKTAACMVMGNDMYAMLLTHDKVKEFSKKQIADAHKTTEVLTALAVESKGKVNELADKALKVGAKETYPPKDTASCSLGALKTLTAIFGKCSGWTKRRHRGVKPERVYGRHSMNIIRDGLRTHS